MKRVFCVVFTIVFMITLAVGCTAPKGTVEYEVDMPPANGQEFFKGNYYQTAEETTLTVPSTYEATLFLPTTHSTNNGVIFGTYSGGFDNPFFNFEIYRGGVPHIYLTANDEEGTFYDVQFDSVNVCTGKPLHLAVTADHENGVWKCYVDGVLQQTVESPAPQPFEFKSKARLGGDLRGESDEIFTGVLQKLVFYKDVRTEREIAKDAKSSKAAGKDLLYEFDFSKTKVGEYPEKIESKRGESLSLSANLLWLEKYDEPENYDYSFAVLGDIQTLTYHHPEKLSVMYDWIAQNAESKKMKFCVGLGDITDQNMQKEYDLVNKQYDKLAGKVPFSIIRGNHDRENGSESAMFEQNITYEKYSSQITGAFDNTMLNTYRELQIGEEKYLFLNLDFALKAEVLDWANTVIENHADYRVIVSTHIYLNNKGEYYEGESHTKYGCETGGQELWDKVLSRHKNIVMVLPGHSPTDNIVMQQKTGGNGNKVTEILIDPQHTDLNYNGVGLVAMFYFSNNGKNLEIRYYSTVNDTYFMESNQLSVTLDVK